jgi:hypothetical protein
MKTSIFGNASHCALLCSLCATFAFRAHGADVAAVQVHGSISATASYSDTYNFLGKTRDQLDLNLVDIALNGTHRFDSGLRAGAQLYAYQIGSFSDITVDWASLDYSFSPMLGARVGRNKVQMGLYNDSQDLDAVRTFASLPFTFYPKTYRAITSSIDGLTLYGNVPLGQAGTIDYQVYGGTKEDIDGANPFIRGINNLAQYDQWHVNRGVYGGAVFWNAPLEGLRIGYSYFATPKNRLRGVLSSMSQMHGAYLGLARSVDAALGAGAWDKSGLFAGTPVSSVDIRTQFHLLSAEYTWNKWLFAAEYKRHDNSNGLVYTPALARLGRPTVANYSAYNEEYYGMVTYQATRQLGLGLYYSKEQLDRNVSSASSDPLKHTKDWAAAVSYALNDAWIFKFECHQIDGLSLVYSAGDDNRTSGLDPRWTYLVVKSTFSF